jgi:hypothetical protein
MAEQDTPTAGTGGTLHTAGAPAPTELARQLTGDLPCFTCRYNLRGLSVKAVCPECGTPIRVAILATVDPYAPVLQPVVWSRLTAAGVVAWATGALLAGLLTWGQRLLDVISTLTDRPLGTQTPARTALAWAAVGCIAWSGVGAAAFIRPHARIPALGSVTAVAGVLATFVLGRLYWQLHLRFDSGHTPPYQLLTAPLTERSLLRLEHAGVLLVILFGLRPNARLLAARPLLMRLGRVDHQTMLTMAAAVAMGAGGDGLQILSMQWTSGGTLSLILGSVGLFMIAVGSMLFTVGLVGIFLNSLRIAGVILKPAPAPSQVLEPVTHAGARV